MNNITKYVLYALIFSFILWGVLFLWIGELLPWAINNWKTAIEYIPLELRIWIFLIFAGLIIALWKSFIQ